MAINIPIITEFSDAGLKSARGAFDQFKTKIGEADGAMGKLKAGSGVAFDAIKANAGAMALGAGAAIGGFALKAIGDFKDLALSVDDFRNKTNLTLLESSKWVSYTGDLGIQADSMTKIFTRVSKAATDQIPAFKELGVAIALGEDGRTDIEETFLRVNDAINSLDDPVKQAAYRADLFGRGWMDAAELINMSSDEIRTNLAGVKDFEVVDEAEIQKAKDLRAAQDELGDAFARLSVTLGEALIPALTALSKVLIPVLEALAKFNGTLDTGMAEAIAKAQEMGYSLSDVAREMGVNSEQSLRYMADVLGMSLDQLYQQLDRDLIPETYLLEKAWREGSRAMIDANTAAVDLGESLMTIDDALAELKGNVDERREWDNLITAIEDAKEAALDAFFEATPEALRESQRELDDARLKVAEYIAEMDNIPDEKKTEMIAALDRANLAEIEAIFNQVARTRNVDFRPTVGGIPVGPGETPSEVLGRTRMATLSSVNPMSGNVTVNVTGSVISQNDLVESVRKGLVNSQRNGAGLVYSNQ
jgi:AraC-like DNA-binding protein